MGAYGDMDKFIPGQIAEENQKVIAIRSRAAKEDISFGRVVCGYAGYENEAWNYKLDTTKLVFSADLSASNSVVITVDGVATSATVFVDTHANQMAAIIAKIKALTFVDGHGDTKYYDCILDTADATNRTLLIRAKGATCVASGAVTGGSAVTITATYQSDQIFLGIATYTAKDVAYSSNAAYAKYFADQAVNIAERGIFAVYVKGTVTSGTPAYVMATSGSASLGYLYASGDSTGAIFKSQRESIGLDYLAALEIRGEYKFQAVRSWI